MINSAFLSSKHFGGLSRVLHARPQDLRTVFIPTAGTVYGDAPWIEADRQWLSTNGFRFTELELTTVDKGKVGSTLRSADLVCIAGGNTYFLLQHVQRTHLWDALAEASVVYAGVSAGAIVACPDVAYIDDMDDRGLAPDLADTTGGGIVDFRILPHMDDERYRPKLDKIVSQWSEDIPLIKLNDDEAIIWRPHVSSRIVTSTSTNL